MMIKKFLADSMPEAMQKIRAELGKDAVILNSKEIKVGGFLGMFRKRKWEVVAAMDPKPSRTAAKEMLTNVLQQAAGQGNQAAAAAAQTLNGFGQSTQATNPLEEILQQINAASQQKVQSNQPAFQAGMQTQVQQQTVSNLGQQQVVVPQVQTAPSQMAAQLYQQTKPPVAQPTSGSSDIKPRAPKRQPVLEVEEDEDDIEEEPIPVKTKKTAVVDREQEQELLKEIRTMREMIKQIQNKDIQGAAAPIIQSVRERLVDQEFLEVVLEETINGLIADPLYENIAQNEDAVWKLLKERMVTKLRNQRPIVNDRRVINFVGPTGVGKTTTLAKLAAEQVLKQKKKVGFITSDTYRISAVDQLKTYASILNVPVEVVFSPQDLPKAMKKLEDRELIFMDTAGRNYRNQLYVSELNNMLRHHEDSLTYLVLSMTTKYKDMRAITQNFAAFQIDRVLFTKIDETESFGSIMNIAHDFGLPPSYITNGQNVPNDIYPFDEEKFVDLILGERSYE